MHIPSKKGLLDSLSIHRGLAMHKFGTVCALVLGTRMVSMTSRFRNIVQLRTQM